MLSDSDQYRISLPQLTICAVSSVNVTATFHALERSINNIEVTSCKMFTDNDFKKNNPKIEIVKIPKINSSKQYSDFILKKLVDHVETSHCLVIQWDGHIIDAKRWQANFLDYDYIGASWPQFSDEYDVGNGGFSLRSKRLMMACREPGFQVSHPEDVAIGRINRKWLEQRGMRFAPTAVADQFSAERSSDPALTFGYHGVFLMPRAIGVKSFWQEYCELDDLGTVRHDFFSILSEVGRGAGGISRMKRMIADRLSYGLGRKGG